jgi:alkaline phosphatase D
MSSTPQYAIWDDHDYGPNDSDRTYAGKNWTLEAFKNFWANPTYGAGDTEGITGAFTWADADFLLLDNRWYRTPQSETGSILGQKQLTYLIESLQSSIAKYKFVCIGGQFLSTVAKYENYANYKLEREFIMNAIDSLKIKGVIFLDGDRHHSEISKWTGPNGTTIHDITSSSLTSGTGNNRDEVNENRIKGSMIIQKNYAFIEVVGPKDNRVVKITFRDTKGLDLYQYTIGQ